MTQSASDSVASKTGSWKQMLTARAVHNAAARVVDEDGCDVAVYVKSVRPWYVFPPISWIVPHRAERASVLDRIGSQVWRWCDGERTVEDIIDAFADEYALTFHEARVAVTGYIKSLVQRGVLAIVIPEEDAA